MTSSIHSLITTSFLLLESAAFGQGTFRNLDFESANIPDLPPGVLGGLVPEADAIPGWAADNSADQRIFHNDISLSGRGVIIYGPHWDANAFPAYYILGGRYSIYLGVGVSIWQTGQVPIGSKSLLFYATSPPALNVSFAGNNLPFYSIATRDTYNVYGADIRQYAGLTGELRFSAPVSGATLLDGISFSAQIVPEPTTAVLLFGGLALFACCELPRRR